LGLWEFSFHDWLQGVKNIGVFALRPSFFPLFVLLRVFFVELREIIKRFICNTKIHEGYTKIHEELKINIYGI
jgi:hypothetical protein